MEVPNLCNVEKLGTDLHENLHTFSRVKDCWQLVKVMSTEVYAGIISRVECVSYSFVCLCTSSCLVSAVVHQFSIYFSTEIII